MRETMSPTTTSTSAPGTRGAATCNVSTTARATMPTASVSQWTSPTPCNQSANCRQLLVPSPAVPVSFGSSPMITSMAAPKRKPVMTAFDRRRDRNPKRSSAATRNRVPATSVMATTSSAVGPPAATPLIVAALAAIAASEELGFVEICRDVPNIA